MPIWNMVLNHSKSEIKCCQIIFSFYFNCNRFRFLISFFQYLWATLINFFSWCCAIQVMNTLSDLIDGEYGWIWEDWKKFSYERKEKKKQQPKAKRAMVNFFQFYFFSFLLDGRKKNVWKCSALEKKKKNWNEYRL